MFPTLLFRPCSWLALVYSLLAVGCGQTSLPSSESLSPPHQEAPLFGEDGELTVTTAGTVLNRYATLAADVSAGATTLELTNATALDSPRFGPLAMGDLVLVIQMQGAQMDISDAASYGTVTNLQGAGRYEFAHVRSVSGNTLHLECTGLRNSYSAAGHTQVVRVPQLTRLTVETGASVVAQPWDGTRGGVVVLHVKDTTTLTGGINVSGQGFRGGAVENDSSPTGPKVRIFVSNESKLGGEKGESIAGNALTYSSLGGRYGRGAPANGGGGGNTHNSGGGGGANGHNGKSWSGQGVMSSSVTGAEAWKLDDDYKNNGNALTDSSGGGRGGYTFSSTNQDALSVGPDNSVWGGDYRHPVGGYGGHPLDQEPSQRLFLGGGGGAGDGNNGGASPGANGGGLVLLISQTVSGTGHIRANGATAADTGGSLGDAPGGGGGGGTVVVVSSTLSGITLEAKGGDGGNQLITTAEAEGPGGGGGGGFIAVSGGSVTPSVLGGESGTTESSSMTEFPANGATQGATGQTGTVTLDALPLAACAPVGLAATLTNGQASSVPGTTVPYTFTVTNTGTLTAANAPVSVPLPANAAGLEWTCTASGGATCPAASGSGALSTTVTLPPSGALTYTLNVTVSAQATGSLVVTGSIGVPEDMSDPVPENNSATDTDTLEQQADLSVTLTESAEPATEDAPLTYTVNVANNGPSTASNIEVTFPIPVGSTFVSGTGTGWSCARAEDTVTCTQPGLDAGNASALALQVVPTLEGGSMDAMVSVDSEVTDPVPDNNSDTETTAVSGVNDAPDLTVPSAQTTPEDTAYVFSLANGNILYVTDADAFDTPIQVTLSATHGVLTLGRTTGLTFIEGDGTADGTMTFTVSLTASQAVSQSLTFTPDAHYHGGARLTFTANDLGSSGAGGPQSTTATVDITVTPVNDPPMAVDDTATLASDGTAHPLDVLANDSFAPDVGETLTVTSTGSTAQGGTVTLLEGGARLAYTPPEAIITSDTFTYTVSDGNGGTATASVTVTVVQDSDNDGLLNTDELARGTSPNDPDSDDDGLLDGTEVNTGGTNPLDGDSDDDGLRDGQEDADHDGEVDTGETDPLNADTDGGGVNDGMEAGRGTNPLSAWDDNELQVMGSGCSATGAENLSALGVWAALVLTVVSRRRGASSGALAALGAVAVLASASPAQAQQGAPSLSTAIDAQQFKPAPGKEDVLGLHGAGVPGHLHWRAGLFLNYADDPLLIVNPAQDSLLTRLVDNQLGFDLVGAVGLGERFEVGFTLPIALQQSVTTLTPTGNQASAWSGGLGDLRLVPKVLLLEREGLRLGLAVPLILPTGGARQYRGQAGLGLQPRLSADYTLKGGTRLLANVGANLRERQELLNLSVGPEMTYGLGAALPFEIQGHRFTGIASLAGAAGLGSSTGTQREELPLELQGALQYRITPKLLATLGVGRGIIRGYGMPAFRVLGGLSWTEEAPPQKEKEKEPTPVVVGLDRGGDGLPGGIAAPQAPPPGEGEVITGMADTNSPPEEATSKVQVTAGKLLILEKVYFATNADAVLPRSFPLLQQVAAVLRANPQLMKIRIEGHTDSQGDDTFNLDLSQRRANSVLRYIVEQGISGERLEAIGYGETKPLDTNTTAQGRENNRRVEFTILETADEAR